MEAKPMKKVLIAAAPDSAKTTIPALENHFAVTVCHSLEDACSALNEDIDAVLCGIHFDEGKMFDLLRCVKADGRTRSIPFLCIKSTEGVLSPTILQSIDIASKALGADGFVELYEWKKKLGEKVAYEHLRQLIDRLIEWRDLRQV